jgi:hypothetical protein
VLMRQVLPRTCRGLLLRCQNNLLLSHQLPAQQRFESAGYSGRITTDLKFISFGLENEMRGM